MMLAGQDSDAEVIQLAQSFRPELQAECCQKHGCRLKAYPCPDGDLLIRCDVCDEEEVQLDIQRKLYEMQLHRQRCAAKCPPKYADLTLGMLRSDRSRRFVQKQEEALQVLEDWGRLINHEQFLHLIVVGDKGTGKTQMLCALVGSLVRIGVSCRYVTMNGLLAEHKGSWKSKEVTEKQVLDSFLEQRLLVIDEVAGREEQGEERLSAAELQYIEWLADERYQRRLKTVYAGNVPDVQSLGRLIGERSLSRAREKGMALVCNWQPHRVSATREELSAAAAQSGVRLC